MRKQSTLFSFLIASLSLFFQPLCAQITVSGDTTFCGSVSITWLPDIIGQTSDYNIINVPYSMESNDSLTYISLTDEDISDLIPLGFDFCFFDSMYTHAWLYSNGFLGFDYSGYYYDNFGPDTVGEFIPTDSIKVPKNCIMNPWTDLSAWPSPHYYSYGVKGTAPNRRFIYYLDSVKMYFCTELNVSSQIILYEGSGVIRCNIMSKPVCDDWDYGRLATQGIHNNSGTIAYVHAGRNATEWEAYEESILFVPSGEAILTANGSPVTGEIPFEYTIDTTTQLIASSYDCFGIYHADTILITIDTLMEAVIDPNGPVDICVGDSLILTSNSEVSNVWSTGDITQSITVFDSGIYILTIENYCLTDSVDSISVIVHEAPVLSSIYESGGILHIDEIGSYQWYFDGEPIDGATGGTYIPLETGSYSVTVTDAFGCSSITEDFYYALLSISNIDNCQITIYPIPATDIITITTPFTNYTYYIFNSSGVIVKSGHNSLSVETCSVTDLPSGMYILLLKNDHECSVRSLIKR